MIKSSNLRYYNNKSGKEGAPSESSRNAAPEDIFSSTSSITTTSTAVSEAEEKIEFDERYYKELCKRVKQKNSERHSLICDAKIKFAVAEKFLGDRIFPEMISGKCFLCSSQLEAR
jgi:hypothetical protein